MYQMSDGRAFTNYTPSFERAQFYKNKFNVSSSSDLRLQMQRNGPDSMNNAMCTKNSSQGQTALCGDVPLVVQPMVDFPSGPLKGPFAAAAPVAHPN